MATQPIDYTALARSMGATSSMPAPGGGRGGAPVAPVAAGGRGGAPQQAAAAAPIDYTALAQKMGATSSTPAPAPAAQPKPRTWLDSVADYGKGVLDNLQQSGEGLVHLVAHPIDTVEGMGAAQDAVRVKAEQAFKAGNYAEGVRHVLGYVLPVVGPAIDAMGDEAQAGHVAHALGEATSLGAQLVAQPAVDAARPPAPMTVGADGAAPAGGLFKSTLNLTQQAAVDYLRANDVPLSAGTVTGNKFLKGAQALAANTAAGAGVAADATRATEAGLTRVAGDLADQAHPAPVSPESAGAAVPAALKGKIDELGLSEDAAYAKAWDGRNDPQYTYNMPVRTEQAPVLDAEGKSTGATKPQPVMAPVNMPVDVTDIKARLKPVWDEMQWMPASDRASSAGFQAVKNILEGDDFIPAWQAEKGLSGLKAMARTDTTSGVRNTSQGIGASIIPDLQDQVNAAVANTGDEAIRGLQEGRALHATKMDVADVADQLRTEPVQAFNQLTWQKDTGISFLRKIADQAPDVLPKIGRAYVQNLFDQATQDGGFSKAQGIAKQWENLGPETKQLLYPNPGLRGSLDNFFLGAKMAGENPNPSGTALVGQTYRTAELLGNGIAVGIHNPWSLGIAGGYLLGTRAIAKALYSPLGVRLLTGAFQPEAAPAAALRAAQILRITGDDDVTPFQGPGAGGQGRGSGGAPPAPGANSAQIPGAKSGQGDTVIPGANHGQTGNAGASGEGPAVSQSGGAGSGASAPAASTKTTVLVPGATGPDHEWQANYKVRELSELQPSHNGITFQPNPRYKATNDRDYSSLENQRKVLEWSLPAQFEPRWLISNHPGATEGPPVVDSEGQVLGGNGRTNMLQRVHESNTGGAQAYRGLLMQQAPIYGIDPQTVAAMKQPVLVREIPDEEMAAHGGPQRGITDFNKSGTAALKLSERAISDSRRVSQGTLNDIANRIEALGPAGTLAQAIEGPDGVDVLNKLMADGVVSPQEGAGLEQSGVLTPDGKTRISKLMLGRFFRDPAELDQTPAAVRNKLERMAAPLATLEGRAGWALPMQDALEIIGRARAAGSKNLDDLVNQSGLLGDQTYSPQAVTLAKKLQGMKPNDLTKAARQYAQDARFASEGTGLWGAPPTPGEAFETAFGK